MTASKEMIQLQCIFANKMAELTGIPKFDAYKEYTRLFKILGIDGWDRFEDKVLSKVLSEEEIVSYVLANQLIENHHENEGYFGCFRYEANPEYGNISLHFSNKETEHISPLSSERIETRKKELKDTLIAIRNEFGTVGNFRFFSWLNNFPPFKRIFPEGFLDNAPIKHFYKSLSYWGQFLDRNGNVRPEAMRKFLANVELAKSKEQLLECFPYKATEVIKPLAEAYELILSH